MIFKRIFIHLLFWIFFSLIIPLGYSGFQNNLSFYWSNYLITLFAYPSLLIGNYFIIYYLVPKFLLHRKKPKQFILFYFITIITIVITEPISRYMGISVILHKNYNFYNIISPGYLVTIFFSRQIHILIFGALKYLKAYAISYTENEELKHSMIEAEFSLLKSQLHPHFLFNTLNNVYSLIVEKRNHIAAESIEKISEILRFILYKNQFELIKISEELNIINNYIDLELLRYQEIKLTKEYPEDLNNLTILPFILFTFVENAFKHGASKTIRDRWISIKLVINNSTLDFTIENSKNSTKIDNIKNQNRGLGLKNAIKRLNLFYGESNYSLKIVEESNVYKVNLILSLNRKLNLI